ncbi:MAG: imidazolonepropionase [Bacteroidales bacterium]|jgi:imidazolonepropionase|nr:imidazolonepropionase [Bacteroidales bacterium]MDD2824882.1 imidazolonepropionase [Bacteroidales bacterium]MDD3100504.1 imidazolonepropionase [Bacteroidales bacterium]MDD3639390.1 imidazolonepropionase [Bacteroidales bacterium]MDD3944027.1 imidazolonepropionase [Bacteroidales bacterium]
MNGILIENIKQLVQVRTGVSGEAFSCSTGNEMNRLPCLENAWLFIRDGMIDGFGPMENCPYKEDIPLGTKIIDATGRCVFPSFCDCHTHIVFAGSREKEFSDKNRGLSYRQIAARGGGILNSAALLHKTTEEELFEQSLVRARELIRFGTGAVEIKSGYGLTVEDEIKMLRVIRRIGEETPLTVKATFLGAHAVPESYKGRRSEYVDLIIDQMIPRVAEENLAQYADVFCETGFFTVEDTERIFTAALKHGLRPRVHANQMDFSGGVQAGVNYGAITVDHLEHTGPEEWDALAGSDTLPVLLPGSTFFLEMDYAPAREMIRRGLPVALATNYNPGSCPAGNMQFMMTLACLKMKLTPEEAVNASTLNGAHGMDLSSRLGSITVGKTANVFITVPIPSYEYFAYAFTSPLVETTILNGKITTL